MKVYWIAKRKAVDVEDGFGQRLIEQGEAIFMPPPEMVKTVYADGSTNAPQKRLRAKRGAKTYEPKDKG